MTGQPRTWTLPTEPDCPVRDAHDWLWTHNDDPHTPWESDLGSRRVCTTWPLLLTRGPLTEEES